MSGRSALRRTPIGSPFCSRPDHDQLLEDALDQILLTVKERVGPAGVQIAEGRLIER